MVALKRPPDFAFPELTAVEWAYLAGIIDGEGTISLDRKLTDGKVYFRAVVSIANTNPALLDWIEVRLPIGNRFVRHVASNWRPSGRITFFYHAALHVVRRCRPYLVAKAGQADILLAMPIALHRGQNTPAVRAAQEEAAAALSALNVRGLAVGA